MILNPYLSAYKPLIEKKVVLDWKNMGQSYDFFLYI